MLRANMAPLVFLNALVAIESSTLKLTRKHIRIFRLLRTVLYAAQATAVTSIELAFSFVILAIAGAISEPYTYAFYDLSSDVLLWDRLRYDYTTIVTIINNSWRREDVIGKHFSVRSPSEAIASS